MLSEPVLKKILLGFSGDDSRLPTTEETSELIPAMLEHIGSIDSELRDDLIYSSFARWILKDRIYTDEQCHDLLRVILDEQHLFFKIGEKDTDSVFTRSFSTLLIPLLLIRHHKSPFLDRREVDHAKECLLRMAFLEKDRRGYVEGKGWAHAVAHASDALDDLAQCKELGVNELREILASLKHFLIEGDIVYDYGEDQRMVTPVIAILRRNLIPAAEVESWVEGLGKAIDEESMPQKLAMRTAVQNFLQALYFRLSWANLAPELLPVIEATLKGINPLSGN